MDKAKLTKQIAEITRSLCGKVDAMNDLMGTELYEYFTEIESLEYLISDLLEAPPGDYSWEIVSDYMHGRIEYDEMLSQMKDAIKSFNWEAYAEHE